MDSMIVGVTVAAAFAFSLINYSRVQDLRRREAEFLARHLRAGRRLNGRLLLTGPR